MLVTAVEEAEVAFSGNVTRALGGDRYEVRVERLLKGTLPAVVTMQAESPTRSSCGLTLPEGPIVYAGGRDLRVMQCMAYWTGDAAPAALAGSGIQATGTPDPTSADPGAAAPRGGGGGFPVWPVALGVGVLAGAAYALRPKGRTPLGVLPPEPSGNA